MKIEYKNKVKQLIIICEQKLPGTKYDRFYCEEMVKKYQKKEELDDLIAQVSKIKSQEDFENIVRAKQDEIQKHQESQKQRKLEEERLNNKDLAGKDWTTDEIKKLSKGLTKFPTGTFDRWKVIATFIGSKT